MNQNTNNFYKKGKNMNREENKSLVKKHEDDIKKWIKDGIDSATVDFCNEFGEEIAHSMSASQIRNVFGEMRRIDIKLSTQSSTSFEKQKPSFIMLKPRLAYAVKRHNNKGIREFNELFVTGFDTVLKENDSKEEEKRFKNFMLLLEGVLAYHKFYGGKE